MKPLAKQFNLTLMASGDVIATGNMGQVILSDAFGTALEPSPITPAGKSPAFAVLAGTISAVFERTPAYDNKSIVVKPSLLLGGFYMPSSHQNVGLIDSGRQHW